METHSPKLIEKIVEVFIPPACREHVLGDLCERYSSPLRYIGDALTTLPFVIASQVRRTFRIQLFVAEACALLLAFGGASLAAGPAFLYQRAATLPLGSFIGSVLAVLVLCDAYADPGEQSSGSSGLDVGLALTVAYFVEAVIGLIHLEWMLPIWLLLAGSAVSMPMLLMLRKFFAKNRDEVGVSGGGITPYEEIRRRSEAEYRRAWRVNWIWMTAALIVVFTTPKVRTPQSGLWEAGSGVFLIVIIFLTGWRGKKGLIGLEQRFTSLSISGDPYRNQLERKRDGLLFWAGGDLVGLLPGAGPALVLFLIALPLFMFLVRWILNEPYPQNVSATRVCIAFIAFLILCAAWAFVRTVNIRAARTMRQQLEALDSSEKKK